MGVSAIFEPHSSTKTSWDAGSGLTSARQAARSSSLRSLAPNVFFARPAHAPNGTTHRRVINPHAMSAFPELAVGFQRAIRMGFQLCDQASFQGRIFLGRTSRNGFGREISGFSSLFQVALDAG